MINFDFSFISENRMEFLLGLSLIPLLIKSINYILIGSIAPFCVFLLFGALLGLSYIKVNKYRVMIIKTWSMAILIWGVARIGLMILFLGTSVQEAHIESQFSIPYMLVSFLYTTLGYYFFKQSRNYAL